MVPVTTEFDRLDPENAQPTLPSKADDPVVKPELPCTMVEQMKQMIKRSFMVTSAMVFVVVIVMLAFSVLVVNQHSISSKKEVFAEIARARGEVVKMVEADRSQTYLLQQSMAVYSDSIDIILGKITALENKINAKPAPISPEQTKAKPVTVVESQPAMPTPTPAPIVKKSFWSRLFSCGK